VQPCLLLHGEESWGGLGPQIFVAPGQIVTSEFTLSAPLAKSSSQPYNPTFIFDVEADSSETVSLVARQTNLMKDVSCHPIMVSSSIISLESATIRMRKAIDDFDTAFCPDLSTSKRPAHASSRSKDDEDGNDGDGNDGNGDQNGGSGAPDSSDGSGQGGPGMDGPDQGHFDPFWGGSSPSPDYLSWQADFCWVWQVYALAAAMLFQRSLEGLQSSRNTRADMRTDFIVGAGLVAAQRRLRMPIVSPREVRLLEMPLKDSGDLGIQEIGVC
jgi:hypothetical protein